MAVTVGLVAGPGGHMWGVSPGWWWIGMVVFWLVVIGLVVWAVRSFGNRDAPADHQQQDRARAILDERYARGDISTEEYRQRRETLR